ncbi:hypothetical protein [Methylibium petroleiphilum]|uniref:Uncharacterized protein n=1 Tax=Methylibium petroleiphilum (strain ATCC BAA-1232 / LMG 22953 / PM1) TaxID=420662 RepID=A2SNM0_METPP|nr:hypothetical protein [Methylibium petroleiphilum]ABM97159.1 hypothetical protein Mpe_B0384 [Methylibium petroleiphilum PM1]
MTSTSNTCLTCAQATPSETINGMLWCLQNMGAGTLRGQFTYKPFNLSPNRAACGIYAKRSSPIVFKERAVAPPEEQQTEEAIAAPAASTRAAPARPKDDFPKEFFL